MGLRGVLTYSLFAWLLSEVHWRAVETATSTASTEAL